jgi:hypothetical protein
MGTISRRLLATLFLVACWGLGMAFAEVYEYHPQSPLYLSGGFDRQHLDRAYPPCLKHDGIVPANGDDTAVPAPNEPESRVRPGETRFVMSLMRSRRDLYHHLHVDTSISASFTFGGGSGSFSLEDELGISSEDIVWIVKGYTDYGRFAMRNPQLNARGRNALNLKNFTATCGTNYIGVERRIAYAAAVYVLKVSDTSRRRQIEASFKANASWSFGSASGSANYSEFYNYAAQMGTINVHFLALGGSGLSKLADLSQLGPAGGTATANVVSLERVQKVIAEYLKDMTVAKAASVDFVSGSFTSFGVPSNDATQLNRDFVLSELYFAYTADARKVAELGSVIRGPATFPDVTAADLAAYARDYGLLTRRLDVISRYASSCLGLKPVEMASLSAQTTVQKATEIEVEICEGGGCKPPPVNTCALPPFKAVVFRPLPDAQTLTVSAWYDDFDGRVRFRLTGVGLQSIRIVSVSRIPVGEVFIDRFVNQTDGDSPKPDASSNKIEIDTIVVMSTPLTQEEFAALAPTLAVEVTYGSKADPKRRIIPLVEILKNSNP